MVRTYENVDVGYATAGLTEPQMMIPITAYGFTSKTLLFRYVSNLGFTHSTAQFARIALYRL